MRVRLNDYEVNISTYLKDFGVEQLPDEFGMKLGGNSRYWLTWYCPTCGTEFYTESLFEIKYNERNVSLFLRDVKEEGLKKARERARLFHDSTYCSYVEYVEKNSVEYIENVHQMKLNLVNQLKNIEEITNQNTEKFLESNCPVCGTKVNSNAAYYCPHGLPVPLNKEKRAEDARVWREFDQLRQENGMGQSFNENIDVSFIYMQRLRDDYEDEIAEKERDNFVSKIQHEIMLQPVQPVTKNIDLKEYITKMIGLETGLLSVSERLKRLYFDRISANRTVNGEMYQNSYCSKEKIKVAEEKLLLIQNKIDAEKKHIESKNYESEIKVFDKKKPTEPLKPALPVLETPGLFNKRKINQENKLKREKYQMKMEQYNLSLSDYNDKIKDWEHERQEHIDKEIQAIEQMHVNCLRTLEKELDDQNHFVKNLKVQCDTNVDLDKPTPAKASKSLIDEEIKVAEEMYVELYKCREQMYGLQVIFDKYRNLPAISTFYEYLMAGRCEALEGANGAYNIYEQELRANIVIGQLSEVIASLEQVKQNQFMIYSELQNINKTLNYLENTLSVATKSIQNIEANTSDMNEYLGEIASNTDVIAHNTAQTAYYSKLNAELTNSLGYMVAFS